MKKILTVFAIFIFFVSCGENSGGKVAQSDDDVQDETVTDDTPDEGIDETADEIPDETSDEITDDGLSAEMDIRPGDGVGPVNIGMKYSSVKELIGEPSSQMGFNRLVTAQYSSFFLELVFASPDLAELKDDAVLISIGALSGGNFSGKALPGMTKDEISSAVKEDNEDAGSYVFYPSGFSVQYENNKAILIGVFSPYKISYDPPEMEKCKTTAE